MSSQQQLLALLSTANPTPAQRQQLLTLLTSTGCDLPDSKFQNSYLLHSLNPNSDQKYIHQQEMIYNGLQLKIDKNILKRWVANLRKKIGDTQYMKRLGRFVGFVSGGGEDLSGMQDMLRDDLTDNQSYKKTIASFKKSGRIDEYIEKLNKYLSVQPLDEEAWLELAEVYSERGHYMKSAFCYEQLLIISPSNDTYTLRLSELYITLNSKNTTQKAIKYLSYLIAKRPDNLRALWVLYRAVVGNEEYAELKEMCYEVINKLYSQKNQGLKIHLAL